MADAPWVALAQGGDKEPFNKLVPCTGYPTPGVIKVEGF